MRLSIFLAVIFYFGVLSTQAQQCGQANYLDFLESEQPGLKDAVDKSFFTALDQSKLKTKSGDDSIYQIRVVFHVVYNNQIQNIDDSLIYSQLRVMNEAFRRTNADTSSMRDTFRSVAADSRIEFVMATEDPNGNPTNGIVRKQSARQTFGSANASLRSSDFVKNGRNLTGHFNCHKEHIHINYL